LTNNQIYVQYFYNNPVPNKKEKIMQKFTFVSLFIVLSLLLAACGAQATAEPTQAPPTPMPTEEPVEEAAEEPAPAAAPSIVDIAIQDGRFTTLVTALEAAGLVETLQGEGPYTVFAPTDEAFAALPEGALDGLLADSEALSGVLLYHVVSGAVKAADVVSLDGQEVATASGEAIEVMLDGGSVMINEAKVIITDIEGSNGVIHVIDAVLLPPADEMAAEEDIAGDEMDQNIVDIALADENFSTLVTALEAAGLVEALQGDGPFTVFAPTNEAFEALPEGALEALVADPEALTDVLLYHVAEGEAMAADVIEMDGQKVETLLGQYLDIKIDGDAVMVDDAQVAVADVKASNGVIHVIDTVLLPETRTIVDIAVEDSRFTTLVAALEAAGLVEALQAEGSFTVFAPTDDAFGALPEGTVEGLLGDSEALTKILLYHVVDGKVMAAQVIELDGQEVETLSGDNIMVMIEDETVKINQSQVIIADIEASNGVIHVIDAVLVP
jgi:transforming growth factor-beta-induced protein